MKLRSGKFRLGISAAIAVALGLSILTSASTASAAGPAPVGLGTAAAFAVLAGTPSITNTGPTVINGDLGIHPAASVTGFPPGTVSGTIHTADAVALQAKNDLATAYVDAAGRPATATHGTLGGLTLVGGVYNAGGVTLNLTGTLTLDGQNDPSSVWIFQATSDLVTASSSTVAFINGAQPCNVFWQVTSSATLGSSSAFSGTILALASITLNSGVSVNGRTLARNGTVTLIDDAITRSTCSAPAATAAPAATVAAATATPVASAAPTAAPSATPAAIVAAATPKPLVATLPSTATEDDNSLAFLILPILVIIFVVLYLVARARRRRTPAV